MLIRVPNPIANLISMENRRLPSPMNFARVDWIANARQGSEFLTGFPLHPNIFNSLPVLHESDHYFVILYSFIYEPRQ
jgi:hypothetical protein